MPGRPLLLSLTVAVAITGCNQQSESPVSEASSPTPAIAAAASKAESGDLFARSTATLFQARPISASSYGLTEQDVGAPFGAAMDNFSPAAEQALRAAMAELSGQFAGGADSAETADEKLNRLILADITAYYAGYPDFPIGYIDVWMGLSPFVVNQINGPLMDTPRNMQDNHQIRSVDDAQSYLLRLNKFDSMVASVEQRFKADAERGWVAPRVILQGALEYFARFTAASPDQHPLVTSFAERLQKTDLGAQQQQALVAEAATAVEKVVYPAYQHISEATRAMLEHAPLESGIWAQPNGAAYYQQAIRTLGDSSLTAEQIHDIGLAEIKRISGEMDNILKQEGYTEGSVGERMVALSEEDRFLYEDSDQGRAQLLSDLNLEIAEVTEKMQPWFTSTPPYAVEVKAYPVEIQDGMPGGEYQSPSVDGSKPGIYWINLRDMQGVASFTLKTLTYHEANPGHHWQIALNLAQDDFPFLRRISPYNAYAEGWALYSEQVAWELGMYEDDAYGNLGRLQDELFRAVRLAVDTGLHHKRWTREQAIAFMSDVTGNAESTVVAEVERYMTWPGQALGYKMGMLKILELRSKAQQALGDRFNIAAFHDLLLLSGAMPMRLLEPRVDSWIISQQ
jgi:uncharacterized protein (DUF885 family)